MNKDIDKLMNKIAAGTGGASDTRLKNGNDKELRTTFVYLVFDISGSMAPHAKTMYQSFVSTCRALTANQNEDFDYKVKLVLFSRDVKEYNSEFQSPDDLALLVSESEFTCGGCTSLGKILDYLDSQFTRDALQNRHMTSADPRSLVVLVTDYKPTDAEEVRKKATERILSNHYYEKANRTLCIYCGDEEHKAEAVALAGSESNIVALGTDISALLAPVIIHSTILLTSETHIVRNPSEQPTPREIAERERKRELDKGASIVQMTDQQIKNELRNMLNC